MDKIKVLHILGGPMGRGGTESFIMNYYRNMDHDRIQFDFIIQGNKKGIFDDELIELGSKFYYLPYKSKHPIKYIIGLNNIFQNEHYKIVHSEMDSMGTWPLLQAKMCKIPVRIAHSHNTKVQTDNFIKKSINELSKYILRYIATDYFACGKDAAIWLFGKRYYQNNKIKIINNAIDLEKFSFNKNKREYLRNKFKVNGIKVIGHIGRFCEQKNHSFLIDVFYEYHKMNSSSCLVLIGSGVLKQFVEKKVCDLGLSDNVIFLGEIDNPQDMYNMFDLFLFPSLYEGLAIVMIEAQANGVPCLVSNTITKELMLSNVKDMSLDSEPEIWAKKIDSCVRNVDLDAEALLRKNGYDINIEAKKLEKLYFDLFKMRQ